MTHTKPMRFSFKKTPEFLVSLFSLGFEAGMCRCDAAGEANTEKSGARRWRLALEPSLPEKALPLEFQLVGANKYPYSLQPV